MLSVQCRCCKERKGRTPKGEPLISAFVREAFLNDHEAVAVRRFSRHLRLAGKSAASILL
jgi:hypothetical protein